MAGTYWDPECLRGVREGTDSATIAALNRSVWGCAVVGVRPLGAVGSAILEDVAQELWIFLLGRLETLRTDTPIEPYLIASAKLIAMATARKLYPLAEKSYDATSDDEDSGGQRERAEFAAGSHEDDAGTLELGADMVSLTAQPPSGAGRSGDEVAQDKHHSVPTTSIADIESRMDREKALELLTNNSAALRQIVEGRTQRKSNVS
jgi:hypothetical protein